jgi:hypothetical protein
MFFVELFGFFYGVAIIVVGVVAIAVASLFIQSLP